MRCFILDRKRNQGVYLDESSTNMEEISMGSQLEKLKGSTVTEAYFFSSEIAAETTFGKPGNTPGLREILLGIEDYLTIPTYLRQGKQLSVEIS